MNRILLALLAATTITCTRVRAEELATPTGNAVTRFSVIQANREVPALDAQLLTVARLVGVVVNRSIGQTEAESLRRGLAEAPSGEPVNLSLVDSVSISVDAARVRYRITSGMVTSDYITTSRDIGQSEAYGLFVDALGRLEVDGILRRQDYDLQRTENHRVVAREGDSSGIRREWTNEYVFVVPRVVDGIAVLGSSLEVSIHRTGAIARVAVGGPTWSILRSAMRGVTDAEIDARFEKEFPNARVAWKGLRYVLDESEVLAPCMTYAFSQVHKRNDVEIVSRAQRACYSLEDVDAATAIWPPNAGQLRSPGDPRP